MTDIDISTETVEVFVKRTHWNEADRKALQRDAANMITALVAERDALKAVNAQLVEAANNVSVLARPHFSDDTQELALDLLNQAIAAAKDVMK